MLSGLTDLYRSGLMASNYTQHQLLQMVPVLRNDEYDDYIMNKKAFQKWYEVHTQEQTNAGTSRLKRFFTFTKDG